MSSAVYFAIGGAIIALAIVRALVARRGRGVAFFDSLGRIELLVLVALLATLVFLGCLQIFMRNFFHSGFLWAEPLMRHIVLWLGCLGAALATARMRHINIDVFSQLLPPGLKPVRRSIVYAVTSGAAFTLGVAALRLVIDEKDFGEVAFLGVKTWVLQAVLPVSFFLICYRSLVNLLLGREERAEDEFGVPTKVAGDES